MKNNKTTLNFIASFILFFGMLIPTGVWAQSHVYKGKVLDEGDKDEPLIGATVIVVGSTKGTVTNINGEFTITAPINSVAKVSYVGYEQQTVKLGEQTNLIIKLNSISRLGEVVIVGFGSMKKENLTGSVDQIKTEKILANRPVKNLTEGLQGQIAGLNITTTDAGGGPSGDMNINIRGFTGVGETGSPLIIVDGVQIEMKDFKIINPQDVESVTLLKDASSSAIYGMQAANGVLIVTTKQGNREKPMSTTFRYLGKWSNLINTPISANSAEFLRLLNYADKSGGGAYSISQSFLDRIDLSRLRPDLYPNVVPDPSNPNLWIPTWSQYGNTQWYQALLDQTVYSDQYNGSISGGGKNYDYYISTNINSNNGMFKYGKDSYKLFSVAPKFSIQLTPWLGFRFIGDYSRQIDDKPNIGLVFHNIARNRPYYVDIDPNGQPIGPAGDFARQGRNINRTDRNSYNGEFTLRPIKDLLLTIKGGYRNSSGQNDILTVSSTTVGPNGLVPNLSNTSSFSEALSVGDFYTFNPYLNYNFNFEQKHNFSFTGGLQYENSIFRNISTKANQLQSESTPSINLAYGTKTLSESITQYVNAGYFGRITYNFKDRYMFEANGRYDGTSLYRQAYRWKFFPSLSAGYMISNESYFEPLTNVVSSLKIRGSWGVLSKPSASNIYDLLNYTLPDNSSYYFSGLTESGKQAYVTAPNQITSSNVTWSEPTTIDFGVDLSFLKSSLSFVFDWYQRTVRNEIGPSKTYPNILGYTPPSSNNTESQTTGFEFTAKYFGKINKNISYSLRATLADYTGKILKYDNPTNDLGAVLGNYYTGKTQGEIWGYVTDKMAKNASDLTHSPNQAYIYSGSRLQIGDIVYKDLNGDGLIDRGKSTLDNSGDMVVIGNTTPRYQYSFGGDLTWNKVTFSIFCQGIGKKDWMPATLSLGEPPVDNPVYFWGGGTGPFQHAFFADHYQSIYRPEGTPQIEGGPNVNGWLPRIYSSAESLKNQQPQTMYLQNAAYLRIKTISISYDLPSKLLKKAFIQKIQLALTCDNVWTFSKMAVNFIDPELAVGNAKIYPMQRVFSLGANITL